ncbi:PREDICTED: uncharacterized protein LOC106811091, partial [Priapulus caudatus]|uniref:Uncharacterized protein LOC106811091 n=1 Tax=Priapulus caudatus TaxID=37621 RepID=A0ABM1ED36_PRICU
MALSKLSDNVKLENFPEIGDEPHHPSPDFTYPFREFGSKKKRAFQLSWIKKWPWLHYSEQNDRAYCFNCVKAFKEKKISPRNAEQSFVTTGFQNWKDGSVKIRQHAETKCHKESVVVTVELVKIKDIGEQFSCVHEEEKRVNREMLLKILSNIRFLAKQALPLRGHGDETHSNFIELLKLRGEDRPGVLDWMKKKTNKYTSADIQNEVLQIMALKVLRQIANNIHSAEYFTIMMDETTDVSNKEQVVLCFR